MNNSWGPTANDMFSLNNDSEQLLQNYVYQGFLELLERYRPQCPNHVQYIENDIQCNKINFNIIVKGAKNTGRIIDGNGRINIEGLEQYLDGRVKTLLSAIENVFQHQSQNQMFNMDMGNIFTTMGGNGSSHMTTPFTSNQPTTSHVFSEPDNHIPVENTPKEEHEIRKRHEDESSRIVYSETYSAHSRITEKSDLKKLDLMSEDNLFRKGFSIDNLYTDKNNNSVSIITATSKNYTCSLTDLIYQMHVCYVNGFNQYLDSDSQCFVKLEYDDTIITGKTDTSLDFFDNIDEISKNHYTPGTEFKSSIFDTIISDIWGTSGFSTTHNAYMFDSFATKRINHLLSKYFRRCKFKTDERGPYEYFDSYPKIVKVSEIINEQNLIEFMKERNYFEDETRMKRAIKYIKHDFINNFVCRNASIHMRADTDLEYVLFNNSLPFSLINIQDKFETIKEINKVRKPIDFPKEIMKWFNEDDDESSTDKILESKLIANKKKKANEIYNKIIGKSAIIFKDRKKVVFQEVFGEDVQKFMETSDWMEIFGELEDNENELTMGDMFKDLDYMVCISRDKDNISYHIYEAFYTLESQYVLRYLKTEKLEKEKVLIQLAI